MSFIKRLREASASTRAEYVKSHAAYLKSMGYSSADIGERLKSTLWRARGPRTSQPRNPRIDGSVTFTGIKELDDKLKAMNSSMQKKPLRKASRAVGKLVLEQMRSEVPENEGFLRSRLKLKARKRSRKYPETVGVTVGFEDDLFKGDTYYAGFLEFGTVQRKTKSGANRGRIEPGRFDFMRPALWSYTEKKIAIFRQAIVEWMNQQQAKGKA